MQLSSYPILHINSTELKPATYVNWTEAAANAPLIHNYNFQYNRIMRKQGLDRQTLVSCDSVMVDEARGECAVFAAIQNDTKSSSSRTCYNYRVCKGERF